MKKIFLAVLLLASLHSFSQSASFLQKDNKIRELIRQARWDDLLLQGSGLLTEEPTRPEGYYYTALAFIRLGQPDKAKDYISLALTYADGPMKDKINQLQQDMDNRLQQKKEADKLLRQLSAQPNAEAYVRLWQMDKTNIDYALNAVDLFVSKKDYESALAILTDPALQDDPDAQALAARLNQTPKMKKINAFNQALQTGIQAYQEAHFSDALASFKTALGYFPDDSKALNYKHQSEDEIAWSNARSANTLDSYRSYLFKYEYGNHAHEANNILEDAYARFAREAVKKGNFDEAVGYYKQYINAYPDGPRIADMQKELCELYFSEAQRSEKIKKAYSYRRAIDLYKQAEQCGIHRVSDGHMKMLASKVKNWSRHSITFMGWVADETNMIGMMVGSLNPRKVGMYVAARTNNNIFESADADWETNDQNSTANAPNNYKAYTGNKYDASLYLTIGLTKKIFHPLWIYAGAGVLVHSQLKEFIDNNSGYTSKVANADQKYTALNPEIGLQLNLGFIGFRYGINKPIAPQFTEDYVQHFGISLNF